MIRILAFEKAIFRLSCWLNCLWYVKSNPSSMFSFMAPHDNERWWEERTSTQRITVWHRSKRNLKHLDLQHKFLRPSEAARLGSPHSGSCDLLWKRNNSRRCFLLEALQVINLFGDWGFQEQQLLLVWMSHCIVAGNPISSVTTG